MISVHILFRFDRVGLIGTISRIKTVQTMFTIGVCGACGYYYSTGVLTSAVSVAALAFTPVFATAVLYGVAMCASKIVGKCLGVGCRGSNLV